MKISKSFFFWPGTLAAVVFIAGMCITVLVSVQQQDKAYTEDKKILNDELSHAKDQFRSILYSDITVANSMAVIYREYGFKNNFDSIAAQLIHRSEYVQAVQLTIDGVITHVYPIAGYEKTIGQDLSKDSLRGKEYNRAKDKKEIFFAGPRVLRGGGTGILGKVPVVIDDTVGALIVVLTKIDLIQQAMSGDSSYAYELVKRTPDSDTTRYFLSNRAPSAESPSVSTEIPEGDWELKLTYAEGYHPPGLPYVTLGIGFLLSTLGFALVFGVTNRNTKLEKIVSARTHDLRERIKELSTIYLMSTILHDEQAELPALLNQIVRYIPSGWQHAEVCEAKIEYDGQTYTSLEYRPTEWKQSVIFTTSDGKEGILEVVYTEKREQSDEGVFLKEERDLINTLADLLKSYINKRLQQESLARSEAQFRVGFESAAIGMALVSPEGKWITVNHALCEMVGYTESELIGRNVSDVTHPDDRESDIEFIKRAMLGEIDHYRKEKRYIHKNGSVVWINLNVGTVRENNKPVYFVGQIENITPKLEADLKFRNLVEKSMVGVYIVQNGRFAYINPRIIEQSGFSETELSNMRVEDFVHPDDVENVTRNINARISGEILGIRYEVRARRKNGEYMWLEMFGNATVYNGKPAIIGTMVNITDQKNAFNELVTSEANLKSIFDNTQVGYLLLDRNLKILSINTFFQEMYHKLSGMRMEVGKYFPDYFLEHRKEVLTNAVNHVIASGSSVSFESPYPQVGDGYYYDSTISPVFNGSEVIGICFSAIDITVRKKTEIAKARLDEERQHILDDLIRRNRDLEQFSYIVSHNVRGPVATILGLSNMATNPVFNTDTQLSAVQGIQKTANNLDSVLMDLNDILALRKNSAEQLVNVSLHELAETAQQMAAALLSSKPNKIETNFSAAESVYGIKSYVQNVFYNMISNAVKYSKPNSVAELSIWSELTDTHVVLHFKDKGIGIDLEKHGEYLFGLYKRFHLTEEGKGMGLFMVKTQVEALEGTIRVESRPNEGTHFIVSFKKQKLN